MDHPRKGIRIIMKGGLDWNGDQTGRGKGEGRKREERGGKGQNMQKESKN